MSSSTLLTIRGSELSIRSSCQRRIRFGLSVTGFDFVIFPDQQEAEQDPDRAGRDVEKGQVLHLKMEILHADEECEKGQGIAHPVEKGIGRSLAFVFLLPGRNQE